MTVPASARRWLRRAQPLLGTLVEVGIDAASSRAEAAFAAAFTAIAAVQRCLSRFDPDSDVVRFNALAAGASLALRAPTATALHAAQALRDASGGLFDVTLGTGTFDWSCDGGRVRKQHAAVRIDLGGIGKGHAVDAAVDALVGQRVDAGWVNAGGDLRAFGAAEVPVVLRDERRGGVRMFARVADGAFATSHFDALSRSVAHAPANARPLSAHASVAAPLCLWADALTKVVAVSGDVAHPLLARHRALAWLHADGRPAPDLPIAHGAPR